MPLQRCQKAGKPGWRWGERGTCYTYAPGVASSEKVAKRKAMVQAVAISHSQRRAGETPDLPV